MVYIKIIKTKPHLKAVNPLPPPPPKIKKKKEVEPRELCSSGQVPVADTEWTGWGRAVTR